MIALHTFEFWTYKPQTDQKRKRKKSQKFKQPFDKDPFEGVGFEKEGTSFRGTNITLIFGLQKPTTTTTTATVSNISFFALLCFLPVESCPINQYCNMLKEKNMHAGIYIRLAKGVCVCFTVCVHRNISYLYSE